MKFPCDKISSGNQLAIASFEPSTSFNFFANDFKTRVDFFKNILEQKTRQRKLLEETETIQSLGLADFSRFNVDGSYV